MISTQHIIFYAAYGWLTFSGLCHFMIDVAFQKLRGVRPPGIETSLYYGLNSAFSIGQIAFGALGLYLAWRCMHVLQELPVLVLALVSGLAWLLITFLYMSYWEPKLNVAIFCMLIFVALFFR
ncbi:MAG: hypothetical protein GAK35_01535 [Herbaspirillum frisingense]|uniref:EamA family transporter n=1 Tax=Herbaspirillum frisingense TaxID=92645 RepID=A0A7V8JUN8_9BURK|nr:MAG: hypothetical protein GAK35_01535 [Herbaspirillum frisingense]